MRANSRRKDFLPGYGQENKQGKGKACSFICASVCLSWLVAAESQKRYTAHSAAASESAMDVVRDVML